MEASANSTAASAHYRLRVYDYPSGVLEVASIFVPAPRAVAVEVVTQRSDEQQAQRDLDNIRRATARAKSSVRRLCLSAGCDRLLTLTYRANVQDLGTAWGHFKRFVRKVRTGAPKWVYVAVAERQKRGAIHFHLAVRGFQNVRAIRQAWLEVIGELGGNIDVTAPRGERAASARAVSCARYLTKYMLKEACREGAAHRYRSSRITVPLTTTRLEATTAREAADQTLAVLANRGYEVHGVFFDDAYGLTWACGWAPHAMRRQPGVKRQRADIPDFDAVHSAEDLEP